MPVTPVDFASLLCSRLCHDLLSPVGALNNGLELLADEKDAAMRERVLELLAESARASASKLKFFRLAFGAAGGFGATIDPREARTAIEGLLVDHKRIELGWLVEDEVMPKDAVKVLMNLALIAIDALIRGGTLDIGAESQQGRIEIAVKIAGPRLVLDPELRATLSDGESFEGVTPRAAGAFLVHSLVAAQGGSVQVSEPADGVMVFGATLAA
ncbi:histidine phosphotransferase family protein [Sphingomonas bacterium]|uniref:histidine phosphotransferase family protein n=1 Tax=Sphingomonas bacterium TaxID=1895847 RepID=UPI0015762F2A|nr:histidine phosphotransferase family protein [Sphingomonas bacterium]